MLQAGVPQITRYDYEGLPEGPPYHQVIEGNLLMSPSPTLYHQRIVGRLHALLFAFLARHPLGEVFVAPLDVFLTDVNVYQPDVIFVSSERKCIISADGIEGAPDLVVEVLSPATARLDKGSKRKVYARTGVRELWLVDPEARWIQVFDFATDAETPVRTVGPKGMLTSELLPGLRLRAVDILA
jgi:Uma2 family endonuclease